MYQSFYTAALGAGGFQTKLGVIANNFANVNNYGFKPKTVAFSDLLNYNLNDSQDAVTELQAGNGMRIQRTYTHFDSSAVTASGSDLDFAIMEDNVFFMVQDPGTQEITYTRTGRFHRGSLGDNTYYLLTDSNKMVLDRQGNPVATDENGAIVGGSQVIGAYTFAHPSHLMNAGGNEWKVSYDAMEPILVENPQIVSAYLENSGTDLAREMAEVIKCQRAFAYSLRMVSTSDEVESTINSLRG